METILENALPYLINCFELDINFENPEETLSKMKDMLSYVGVRNDAYDIFEYIEQVHFEDRSLIAKIGTRFEASIGLMQYFKDNMYSGSTTADTELKESCFDAISINNTKIGEYLELLKKSISEKFIKI